ncbi:MAG TPA: AAA family ATPase [Oscillospiraceae bacterium]|nr:AAA family ATPase [Oscillospiraceae bacterium]
MGTVTVLTSGKGGVGKSTTCVGLGCALARRGKRVLLVDGDAGLRSLDRMLGIDEQLVFDISDIISGNCEPIRAIYPCTTVPGLFLLPAPSRVENTVNPELMRRLVPILAQYYDHVLIDCPAGIGRGFVSSVSAADRALVVTTPDPICLRDSDKVRRLLLQNRVLQQRLVINRFNHTSFRKMGCYSDLDSVIDSAGIRLIAVIPEDLKFVAAAANSVPCPPKSTAAMAFNRLAARLEGEQIPLAALERL